jgi:hypothetical protein
VCHKLPVAGFMKISLGTISSVSYDEDDVLLRK